MITTRLCFVAVGTLFGLALVLLLGGAVLLAFGDTLAQYVGAAGKHCRCHWRSPDGSGCCSWPRRCGAEGGR